MKHSMSIYCHKKPYSNGVVNIRNVAIRERILRFLLGAPQKLTIIVPGNSVEAVAIQEVLEGGTAT